VRESYSSVVQLFRVNNQRFPRDIEHQRYVSLYRHQVDGRTRPGVILDPGRPDVISDDMEGSSLIFNC